MVTTEVREGDLVGTFGCPDGEGLFDGVLALGGSDGGNPDYLSGYLSLRGSHVWRWRPSTLPIPSRRLSKSH